MQIHFYMLYQTIININLVKDYQHQLKTIINQIILLNNLYYLNINNQAVNI